MRQKLLTILILLTGIVYLASVFEFDSKEMQQNYQKENHCYVAQHKPDNNSITAFSLSADLPQIVHYDTFFIGSTLTNEFSHVPEPVPLQRLYLHNSVLLI